MTFTNEQIGVAAFTALDELAFEPLPRKALVADLIGTVVLVLGLSAATLAAHLLFDLGWWSAVGFGVIVALATLQTVLVIAAFQHRGWAMREHDLSYRQGIVAQTTVSVPFSRIQHATVKQGAIDRALGLASLEVFTAGGVGRDLAIRGLHDETAARLKDHVLASTDR